MCAGGVFKFFVGKFAKKSTEIQKKIQDITKQSEGKKHKSMFPFPFSFLFSFFYLNA